MSKISITPNASGTGVFTISSPATNTDRTLTLPDEAGSIVVNTATGIDVTGTVVADGLTMGSSSVSAGTGLFQQIETAGNNMYVGIGSNNSAYVQANGEFRIATGGYQDKVTVDASGTVGIGVVPSAWRNLYGDKQLDIGAHSALYSEGGNATALYNNLYRSADNSIKYKTTNTGAMMYLSGNSFSFQNAAVGSAGATATPTIHMRITSGGNLCVGSANTYLPTNGTPGVTIVETNVHVGLPSTAGADVMRFDNPNGRVGHIEVSGSSTSYLTSSDYRLKTDAQPMTGASDRVLALKPVNFAWIVDGTRVDGFLAHEAQAIVPECVTGTKDAMRDEEYEVTAAIEATYDEDGNELTAAVEAVMGTRSVPHMQGIDQSKLVPLLTAALQEALNKIDAMEIRLAALEAV